jgi:hypothetical protein
MQFTGRICLPVVASGAMAVLACSSPGASQTGNNIVIRGDEGVEERTGFPPGQSAFDIARSLCTDIAIRRFGISSEDITGSSYAGGGESPQSIEGQATLSLFGPPSRTFRCEVVGGAVTSIVELDDNGDPVAARN